MKKILLIIFITMTFFPYEALAKEKIVIECEENTLYNNQEIDCKIIADNFDYIVTSITGKIKTSDNLIITNSLYDDSKWMILDDVFTVEDINLISETKEEREYFVIANFRLKAINKEKTTGIVSFEEVIIGDEYYDEKEKTIENISLELKYDEKQDIKINKNIIILLISLAAIIISSIYLKKLIK